MRLVHRVLRALDAEALLHLDDAARNGVLRQQRIISNNPAQSCQSMVFGATRPPPLMLRLLRLEDAARNEVLHGLRARRLETGSPAHIESRQCSARPVLRGPAAEALLRIDDASQNRVLPQHRFSVLRVGEPRPP